MPQTRTELHPQIVVGDKLVQVGPLDWGGFRTLVDELARADLPLPSLEATSLRQKLAQLAGGAGPAGGIPLSGVVELAVEFVAGNLPVLYQWALKHPPLLTALVRGSSNLNDDEVRQLSAGQALRVARAAWQALLADGFFAEAAGFFGELVGLRAMSQPADQASSLPPPAVDSASESRSISQPSPAGT
ncbi:MAG TPA: hypothetical protein VFW87_00520 [Pirellulales bacterium]|nr:hypothetical protein [Pirellulales bacterium]